MAKRLRASDIWGANFSSTSDKRESFVVAGQIFTSSVDPMLRHFSFSIGVFASHAKTDWSPIVTILKLGDSHSNVSSLLQESHQRIFLQYLRHSKFTSNDSVNLSSSKLLYWDRLTCRCGSTEKGTCLVNRSMLARIQSSALATELPVWITSIEPKVSEQSNSFSCNF